MASYPTSVKSFPTHVDNSGEYVMATHVNDIQNEIAALEAQLIAAGVSIATVTPTANAVPKADGAGKLANGWMPSPRLELTANDGGSHNGRPIVTIYNTATGGGYDKQSEIQLKGVTASDVLKTVSILFKSGNSLGISADGASIVLNEGSGSVGVGMNPSVQFELSGAVGQKASGTTWSNPSDKRLKKNVKPFTDGLNVITKIKPVTYELNGLANTPKGLKGISVIAQEIKDVAPYTVDTYKAKLHPEDKEDTELYRFEASALIFVLINAVKELSAKVEKLESESGNRFTTTDGTFYKEI